MSAQKRGWDGSSKQQIQQNPIGIFPIHPTYRPYSIKTWVGKDRKTNKVIVHKNEEKPRELLDFLLNVGNANSFKVKTDKEGEAAIDKVFNRDHDWGNDLLNSRITVEEFGAKAIP